MKFTEDRKQQLFTLLLGALIGLFPSIILGLVNYELGLKRLAVEQRLGTYNEYTKAFNTLIADVSQIRSSTEATISLLTSVEPADLKKGRGTEKVVKKALLEFTGTIRKTQDRLLQDIASVNAQTALVNSVFSENIKLVEAKPTVVCEFDDDDLNVRVRQFTKVIFNDLDTYDRWLKELAKQFAQDSARIIGNTTP